MHEQADLLDSICNVRVCEGKVLECTSQALVVCGVGEGVAVMG